MNATAADRPIHARLRSGLPVLGLALALSLGACSVEDSPGSWSPPSTPTSDVEPTTGDVEPTTEAPAGADLTGTWELRTDFLQDAGQATSTGAPPPSLTFEDGRLNVDTGCNTGGGDYEISGDEVTLSPIALTMRACEGQVGDLEGVVVGLLNAGTLAVGVEGDTLTLTAEDGTTLAFGRSQGGGDDAATTTMEPTITAPAPTGPATSAPTDTARQTSNPPATSTVPAPPTTAP